MQDGKVISNRFAKACVTCQQMVKKDEGYAKNQNGMWHTYCQNCLIVPKTYSIQQSNSDNITEDGKVYFSYSIKKVEAVKSLPHSVWIPSEKCWKVSIRPEHISRVVEVCKNLGFNIPEKFNSLVEETLEVVESIEKKIEGKNLFPFQVDGVSFLNMNKKCLLADEMGLGKTPTTICSLPDNMPIIVVCPASLKFNWKKEFSKWRPEIKTIVIDGKNNFVFPKSGEAVIINYDILPKNFNPEDKFVLVCDEVHMVKNYKAARHKVIKAISKMADRVIGITGTPIMNKPFDLFGVLSSMNMEKDVFASFNNFVRLFQGRKNSWGAYDFSGPLPEVSTYLKRVMLRRLRHNVLPDLPKKTITNISVNNIPKELILEMNLLYKNWSNFLKDKELPRFEEFASIRARLAQSRIPALMEIVESHEDALIPLVVFSAHKDPINQFVGRDGWETITGNTPIEKRNKIVEDFQAGKLKGVALTIQAGGVGLTLTHAWKAIFVDLDWTPALNSQAEDRICRIGQTNPCEIVRMSSNHPLDEHLNSILSEKMDLFQKAIDGAF